MKVLLTGVTGYIGHRLLPMILNEGHEVICCVRDKARIDQAYLSNEKLQILEVDFLKAKTLSKIPDKIDVAYYLMHSMSTTSDDFDSLEEACARNFTERLNETSVKQVIYLSGIVNEKQLSKHLESRKNVETILSKGHFHLSTLRAGIIVGSGSASFEIIRDLVEKLPLMITPRWLNTRSQPISISNVLAYLLGILGKKESFDKSFDIGGPDILTYKEMLLKFAKVRGLKRRIITLPVMTPRLSSYWLYFVTSTSYKLAVNLVNSMKIEVVCQNDDIKEIVEIELIDYEQSVKQAFDKIEQQNVISSWTDALSIKDESIDFNKLIKVPTYGCFKDERIMVSTDVKSSSQKIWSIGGSNGWYYGNWLWEIRGILDKLMGGVGLQRGRKNQFSIQMGESLDFWRVILASKKDNHLLLYAEMKLPGEAWLEFIIKGNNIHQTATFRPKGLWGRLYWYAMLPFHHFIFNGMLKSIAKG